MECDICDRNDLAQVGIHCTVCARTSIYNTRLDNARLLLEKETLGHKIELATSILVPHNAADEIKFLNRAWRLEVSNSNIQAVKQRIEISLTDRATFKEEMTKLREDLELRRAGLAQRRKGLEIIKQQVPSRQKTLTDKLSQIGSRGNKSFDNINNSTTDTRAFLCREAATLLGLRFLKVKDEEGGAHGRYLIAGHIIPDLRHIHSK